ncbi:MAG: hypothetical protein F6K41_15160 [Symploca sp. SIO3E6]|nr:hypothetical protein [Caldora sp. SIO3E6]
MNKESELIEVLCRKQVGSPGLIELKLSLKYAIFLAVQIHGAKFHPANQSQKHQLRLQGLLTALHAGADRFVDLNVVEGLNSEFTAGATFHDLTQDRKAFIFDQLALIGELSAYIGAMNGLDAAEVARQAGLQYYANRRDISPEEIDQFIQDTEHNVISCYPISVSINPPSPRYCCGFFIKNTDNKMSFHTSGTYDNLEVARTAVATLRKVYPEPNWVILQSIR